ncbi:MAG: Uma2 family endonuclease [Lyngbya sp. HA4199-MV5]|nr:Uma2 family endonuclease [Lyngbya sp. HA4199-MV5]
MTDTSLINSPETESLTHAQASWLELGIPIPPTQDELPYDDGIPMESPRHKLQMELLIDPLVIWLGDQDAYVGGNMFVYFSPDQVKTQDYRGPDVFVALDVPKGERKSWVTWCEPKAPDIVIELLSDSTAAIDKGRKKEIYQNQLRATEYFWFNPFDATDLAGFRLIGGSYEPIAPTADGQLISPTLNLALVRWSGDFKGTEATWLRWATPDGTLLPNDQETVEQERQRAEQECQRAEQECQRAEQERQRAEQERQRAEQAEQELERLKQQLQARGITLGE